MRVPMLAVLFGVVAILSLSGTATAQGGEELGACLVLNFETGAEVPGGVPFGDVGGGVPEGFTACIDNVDESFCDCGGGDPNPSECFFLPGETCAEQDVPWDGACDAKGICFVLASPVPGASEMLCTDSGLPWYPGTTICGGVPTLPRAALGILAFILLAGTLAMLTVYGKRT